MEFVLYFIFGSIVSVINWLFAVSKETKTIYLNLYDSRYYSDEKCYILHSYFLKKTDQEIANEIKAVQSTVCRRRQKILQLLKELIAEEGG